MTYKLAIVGSGVSAIGALRGILDSVKQNRNKVDITIFEESDQPFTGFAYNPEHTQYEHWLNANTQAMQIGGVTAFKEWLEENYDFCIDLINEQKISEKLKHQIRQNIQDLLEGKEDVYIPRNIFGFFLQHEAKKTIEMLQGSGCSVKITAHTKILDVTEFKKSQLHHGIFYRSPEPGIKIDSRDSQYYFDKILITAGNTIDTSHTPDFLYLANIKEKIIKLILASISGSKASINIAINHATLSGLDAQRTINECVQLLREQGLIPCHFQINTYIISNNLARVPFPNRNFVLPYYQNKFLNLEYFKALETNAHERKEDFNPIAVFEELIEQEMQEALSKFNITSKDLRKYHLKLLQELNQQVSGLEFFKKSNQYFESMIWKDMVFVKDIAIFRYYRKLMLNSTLLIYYIFEKYKDKVDLKSIGRFLIANLALSPTVVLKDTLERDPNINKNIITEKKLESLGLHFDLSIDTWTRDPKFEKSLFKQLPIESRNVGIVKLDSTLANNGFVAYHKGIEAAHSICNFDDAPSQSIFNSQEQIYFT